MPPQNEPSHHGVKETASGAYPNETLRLLIERASCRSFSAQPVTEEELRLIIEAGIHAASGGNLQPFSIIQIREQSVRDQLAERCGQPFMATVPVHFLYCIDWHRLERWARLEKAPYTAHQAFRHFWISFQDVIIAAQNMCTAIDALGLGSVYIGTIMEFFPEARTLFSLPKGVFPVVLLCLGHPKARPMVRKKLAPEILIHDEKYREPDDQELLAAFESKYPGVKLEITPERMAQIDKVCRAVANEKSAEETLAYISEQGYINAIQRYFGLHYVADEMRLDNARFVQATRDAGFEWFSDQGNSADANASKNN